MYGSNAGLEAELRMSPKLVWVAFTLLACFLYVGAEIRSPPWEALSLIFTFCLVLFGAAGTGWLLETWQPLAGRWAAISLSGAVVYAGIVIFDTPAALLLASLPVALAMAVLGLGASVIVAVAVSVWLSLAVRHGVASAMAELVGLAHLAVWATLSIMAAMHWQTHKLIVWLEDYFEKSVQHVEAARGQKEELEQVLEGYASANRQLALANERAISLRAAAEEAQRTKATFVANVSHEFRTPLNMIIGLVDLMMQAPATYTVVPSPEMREDLRVIHRNCEYLSDMVNDVLDLTRVEGGRMALHRDRVDLGEIIHNSVDVVRPLLDKKQLSVAVTVPDELPLIYCDRIRIQQVVLNLVSNAARFTDQGGIDVSVQESGHQVTVSVRDTGTGIDPQDVDVIFQPFEQGTLWHGKGGSGLGLSLSKRFVELHGGEMHLESMVGVGTLFYFTLPISPPLDHVVRPGNAIQPDWVWREQAFRASRRVPAEALAKPCVVVYDESDELDPWLDHYRDQVEPVVAEDRTQLHSILETRSAHALLLSASDPDALLPLMKSVEGVARGTPILACSIPHYFDRAREAGAAGHLLKPVRRSDLEAAIRSVGHPVRRVLVVDDDPDVLQLYCRLLKVIRDDMEVVTATNGYDALEALRNSALDLMLLDIVMPKMDGWQVLATVRQDRDLASVPIFLISAQDSADHSLMGSYLLATIEGGIPLSKILSCSCELSALLLSHGDGPCPALG